MKIMVECYHDTALVRSLGVPVRSLGHEHGKGNVLLALAKWKGMPSASWTPTPASRTAFRGR